MRRFLFIVFLGVAWIAGAAEHSTEVLVYGATPAGVCAAVGAAREGASVLLVEPTAHVGGVNTGGLSFSDSNQTWRVALRGLFEEFHQRIEDDYKARGVTLPYTVAEKDQKVWTYEPHVAARVTDAMLKEAGVSVLTERALQRVEKDGARLKKIFTTSGGIFAAKTFIDATYEGDLMAAAGVSWTIGREGRKEFGESLAGKQYPKKPMPISGLDATGNLLPLITTKDAGPVEDGDRNVMVYSFRLCLTAKPENRMPFPEPAKYDPARFEAVRRYFSVEKKPVLLWDLYPLPGEKADANNGIGKQFSMGIIGGGNAWCEADTAGRAKIWEEHKQYTLELYKFLTTDPVVPQNLRDQLAKYGLCKDEFAATGHWSPQLYVREGRRMRGATVMTQADILSTNTKPDTIAVASFPIDSHDCQRVARGDGTVINEGTIFPFRFDPKQRAGPAYQVPYRALTPKADECTNLLVPVALSATHVAYSSIRVEPSWMTIGHSAGIAAAMAAKQNKDVQKLDYAALRERLLAQKQALELPRPAAPVSPGLLKSEFIYESAPFPSCHASTLVETSGGGLVAAWFGGTAEKNPDVGIWVARHAGGQWTAPIEVANGVQPDGTRHPSWNPVLFQPKTGPLLLFYKVGPDPSTWWGMLRTSDDGGKTWSEARRLPDGILGPIKNKPVQLANGDILSPTSSEHDGWRVHFERSSDGGKTWLATKPVSDGVAIGAIQPSVLFLGGDRLAAIGRTRQKKVFHVASEDGGQSWGKMTLTDLPNPNSGTDAVTLKDGRHLIIYNHTAKGRSPLNLAASIDGQTWQAALVLESEPEEYSYPAIIQSSDGLVHLTYTWKRQKVRHAVIDPAKLVLRPIVNGEWPQ